jgi:pullulanase/glycogen debranching enzyme
VRNLFATLLLSQGVPQITAGDEIGRTQRGNNNAYCQDNELSWLDWDLAGMADNRELFEFARRLIELRRKHPALRRRHFFQGQRIRGAGRPGHHLAASGRSRDQRSGLGSSSCPLLRPVPDRRGPGRAG